VSVVTIRLAEETQGAARAQLRGGERPAAGCESSAAGTDGASVGTSGANLGIPRLAYLGVALFISAMNTVNALSALHDIGPRLAPWKPFAWEYSSLVLSLAALPAIGWLTAWAPFERGRLGRFALAHLLGTISFCLLHVGGFIVLRKLIYGWFGERYEFGGFGEVIYEFRKDFLGYCAILAVFILSARLSGDRAAAPASQPLDAEPMFDIRDGAKLIRTPVGEIVSAQSAGNYVEFHLADGRRPLMRATLSSVEAALAAHGFLRTHRSWLVNPQRVRSLEPEGSGDWRIGLEGGAEAPLSRRFPQALEALRRPL
jgi:hypothetical protein